MPFKFADDTESIKKEEHLYMLSFRMKGELFLISSNSPTSLVPILLIEMIYTPKLFSFNNLSDICDIATGKPLSPNCLDTVNRQTSMGRSRSHFGINTLVLSRLQSYHYLKTHCRASPYAINYIEALLASTLTSLIIISTYTKSTTEENLVI